MKILIFVIAISLNVSATWAGCAKKIKLKTIETAVYQCDDGTISYNQAYYKNLSSSKTSYNGLCGATAASNVIHAFCKNIFTEPTQLGTNRFSDITPGIRPDTLEAGLNSIFNEYPECPAGVWKYYYTITRFDFLNSLKIETSKANSSWVRIVNGKSKKVSPVIVLVNSFSTNGILHYVTVIDVVGYDHNKKRSYLSPKCQVIYNDFGTQTTRSCKQFIEHANQVDDSLLTSYLPEYVHFVFEK